MSKEENIHAENNNQSSDNASQKINDLLGGLGDHYEFNYSTFHFDILPYIFYDDGDFHFFKNKKSLEESGLYTFEHHHPVRTSDHNSPDLDLSITNLVAFQFIGAILLIVGFLSVAKKYKKNPKKAPSGFQNMMETLVLFVKEEVVRPNLDEKTTKKLLPYFLTLFFFILILNLIGMIPGGHAATGSLGLPLALAIIAFFVINIVAIVQSGLGHWFHHLLGGAPAYLAPLMVPLELMGMLVKPFALTVRLFANMVAGHVVLYILIGLIFLFGIWFSPILVGFSVFIFFLEILVAFLQAYIFTMLTVIFVSLAIGESHEEAHSH